MRNLSFPFWLTVTRSGRRRVIVYSYIVAGIICSPNNPTRNWCKFSLGTPLNRSKFFALNKAFSGRSLCLILHSVSGTYVHNQSISTWYAMWYPVWSHMWYTMGYCINNHILYISWPLCGTAASRLDLFVLIQQLFLSFFHTFHESDHVSYWNAHPAVVLELFSHFPWQWPCLLLEMLALYCPACHVEQYRLNIVWYQI